MLVPLLRPCVVHPRLGLEGCVAATHVSDRHLGPAFGGFELETFRYRRVRAERTIICYGLLIVRDGHIFVPFTF